MAKGDDKRSRNQIQYQGNLAQNNLNNMRTDMIVPQAQQAWNNQQTANTQAMGDYRDIMNQYKNFQTQNLKDVTAERVGYGRNAEFQNALGGYQNFANTGGFSEADLGALRARGISPIQAVYQNARNDLDRQRALQGGYSPNYTAAVAKMQGGLGSRIADATQNVNAAIAEMVQKGKQFGLQGLGNLSMADMQLKADIDRFNSQQGLNAAGMNRQNTDPLRLAAIQGQANLYSATPGMANMFGNQANATMNNWLQAQNQQNQLGLGIMGQQNAASQLPGTWENTVGRIKDVADIGAGVAGAF